MLPHDPSAEHAALCLPPEERLFWLSNAQWELADRYFPRGATRHGDTRMILSGILYVLLSGCRWQDCPKNYGTRTAVYQAFRRWRHRPFWTQMLLALAEAGWVCEAHALDPLALTLSRPARHGRKIDRGWRQTRRKWLAERTMRASVTATE
ncbi:transposase [Methylobacterium soli]|uniref:Transposase n=1 Tax=Methylobacterium soli TaxID=553447 RepID=A0A6L3T4P5_9HYPH|nr:transposase [Methylobacterium soli]